MINANQIAVMISDALTCGKADKIEPRKSIDAVAEKIATMVSDDGSAVAAAALENEVTSTLMDMLAATVLATLVEEEGGGRANISYSPMSMDHMLKHYSYSVENDGLIRTVRIAAREDSDLRDESKWREPSNRHGVMHQDEDVSHARPQAEPKDYDRPLWVVSYFNHGDSGPTLLRCLDRADAERQQRAMDSGLLPVIQNRNCLHPTCPASGCTQGEVTS